MLPCHGPTSWFEGGPLDYFEKQCLNTHPHTFEPVVEPLKPLPHSPLHFRLLFPNPLKFSYPSTPKNYKGAYPNLYYTTKNKRFITKKHFWGTQCQTQQQLFFWYSTCLRICLAALPFRRMLPKTPFTKVSLLPPLQQVF